MNLLGSILVTFFITIIFTGCLEEQTENKIKEDDSEKSATNEIQNNDQQKDDQGNLDIVVKEPEDKTNKEGIAVKIEDFSSYKTSSVTSLLSCPASNSKGTEIINNAKKRGIKELALFDDPNDRYELTLYLTDNTDKLSTQEFKDALKSCGELGTKEPLKAFDNYLLWGWPMCSGGSIPGEDQVGYKDYQNCFQVQQELTEYLK